MQEPLEAYCRLGVVHFMLYPECIGGEGPIAETIARLACDRDIEVVEVGLIRDPAVRREVAAVAQAAGLTLVYAAQPMMLQESLNPASSDASVRAQAVRRLLEGLDVAGELGAAAFAMMSGPDPGPSARTEAVRHLAESIRAICDKAAEAGISVVLEPFDREVDRKALIGPTIEAVEVWRRVERANFGLLIDLSHLPLLGERPRDVLPLVRECLVHTHIGNCVTKVASPLYGDQHPPFGVPEGENSVAQIAEFLRVLLDLGYLNTRSRPVVSFEVRPPDGAEAAIVLAGAKRFLRAAWLEV